MPIVHITRRERFSAAHRLGNPAWTDEKNLDVFGKCSNPNWHGHNYELWVTVKAEVNKETGFVVNLKQLSRLMHVHVIDLVDNKNLDYPSFDGWGYAVFGKVTEGMEVVDKIAKVSTGRSGPHQDVPKEPVIIQSVKIISEK